MTYPDYSWPKPVSSVAFPSVAEGTPTQSATACAAGLRDEIGTT